MKTCLFLANGFEEIEALSVVDFFRRAGAPIETVSITDSLDVEGSHQIQVKADKTILDFQYEDYQAFILPGGQPGSTNLKNSSIVKDVLIKADKEEKKIGAICAAPSVLVSAGIVNGKRLTSYPGSVSPTGPYQYSEEDVEIDGHIVTSRAVGTAFSFVFTMLQQLEYDTEHTRKSMLIP